MSIACAQHVNVCYLYSLPVCSGLYSDASRSYMKQYLNGATYINIWRVTVSDLRSIGDDKVGGVNIVNEGSGQVDCTSTRVCHLLLGPGFIHMYVYTLVLRGRIKGKGRRKRVYVRVHNSVSSYRTVDSEFNGSWLNEH